MSLAPEAELFERVAIDEAEAVVAPHREPQVLGLQEHKPGSGFLILLPLGRLLEELDERSRPQARHRIASGHR
jgi:hypothetical protein